MGLGKLWQVSRHVKSHLEIKGFWKMLFVLFNLRIYSWFILDLKIFNICPMGTDAFLPYTLKGNRLNSKNYRFS